MKKAALLIVVACWAFATRGFASERPWDLLESDPDFRKEYRSVIGKTEEAWLRELSGPAPRIERVSVGRDSEEYLLLRSCKPRYCDTDNVLILYSPKRRMVYGKLRRGEELRLLGNPPSDISSELERLYDERHKGQ